jgi:hypothetical protein
MMLPAPGNIRSGQAAFPFGRIAGIPPQQKSPPGGDFLRFG